MELTFEVYSLNFLELAILASSRGIKKIFGFPLLEIDLESINDMLFTLHKMVKRNILTSDGEAFHMNPPFDEMITLLANAKSAFVIYPGAETKPMRCCYIGDKILISEISSVQKNTIKFFLIRKEYFMDFVEECYLPEQLDKEEEWIEPLNRSDTKNEDLELFNRKSYEMNRDINNQDLDVNKLLSNPEVYLFIEKIELETGNKRDRLLLLEKPLNYHLVISNHYDTLKLIYNIRTMREQLMNLLGEEEQ